MSASNQKSIGVMVAVIVVAGLAWGIYAWKFTKQPGTDTLIATNDSGAAAPTTTDKPRETGSSSDSPRPVDPPVRANAPASVENDAVEITVNDNQETPTPMSDATSLLMPAAYGTSAAKAMKTGRDALSEGEVLKARAALSRALQLGVSDSDRDFIRRELTEISDTLVFGRGAMPKDPLATIHVVKQGENLHAIATQYKLSEDFIMTINGHKDRDMIWAGMRLKVVQGPFSAKVYKADHRMDIFLGDVYVRSYPVGLGTEGGTPLGEWTIKKKIINPDWSDPASGRYYTADDPENPIGERWLSMDCVSGECMGRIGFGIHGTIDPKSIGADMSMGCIRLSPDDVAWVYELLVPRHSRVTILP